MAILNRATATRDWQRARRGRGDDGRLRVEQIVEARHGCGAALKEVRHPAKRNQRPRKVGEIKAERHKRAHADGAINHHAAANPEHGRGAEAREHGEGRIHEAIQLGEAHVHSHVVHAHRPKALRFGVLLPVGAHDAHAGEIFLRAGGEFAKVLLHRLKAIVHGAAEFHHHERQRDHRQHRHGGKARTDAHHEHKSQHAAKDRVGEVHNGRAGGEAHGAEVVGEARHDLAGAGAAKPSGVEGGEMRKEIVAQVILNAAAEAVEQLPHEVAEHHRHEAQPDHGAGNANGHGWAVGITKAVDGGAQKPRDGVLQYHRHHHTGQPPCNLCAVGAVVWKKTEQCPQGALRAVCGAPRCGEAPCKTLEECICGSKISDLRCRCSAC